MAQKNDILKRLHVLQGDITEEKVDAIVNAAHPSLLGGGGVDGAIHRAAGPQLLEECRKLGGCSHGEARITGGYQLPASYVIHTPGPIYRGGSSNEAEVLKSSYLNSLLCAQEKGLRSIAFPAISTGVYGYPRDEACRIAIDSVVDFMEKEEYFIDVYYVLFDNGTYLLYKEYLEKLREAQ